MASCAKWSIFSISVFNSATCLSSCYTLNCCFACLSHIISMCSTYSKIAMDARYWAFLASFRYRATVDFQVCTSADKENSRPSKKYSIGSVWVVTEVVDTPSTYIPASVIMVLGLLACFLYFFTWFFNWCICFLSLLTSTLSRIISLNWGWYFHFMVAFVVHTTPPILV